MKRHCSQCRNGLCETCYRLLMGDTPVVCPFCKQETKLVSIENLWNSMVVVEGVKRWVNGYENDEYSEIIKPYAKAYDMAKAVLTAYWRIQTRHPSRSFALPIATLDVVDKGMFIEFRNEERKDACLSCHCDKEGTYTVRYRPTRLERSLQDPIEVAALLDELVQTEFFWMATFSRKF